MSASNFTEKDIGFFILIPANSEITDELLQDLTTAKDESIHIFISDWLVYEPPGEEDSYCWQIPGINSTLKMN
jgi:hypothetical protein